MTRIAYVNGRYVPLTQAQVHVEDRGYQFGDGVYEVIGWRGGRFVDFEGHMDRLFRSLRELRITPPMSRRAMSHVIAQTVRQNTLGNAKVYIQVSRGQAPRDFKFPAEAKASFVVTVRPHQFEPQAVFAKGVKVVTTPDLRWARRDIKSVALLAQVLSKQAAADKGAYEAWMVDEDGYITEGSSSSAWIVTQDGVLKTRHASRAILQGVTGTSIKKLMEGENLVLREQPFSPAEAKQAKEAFITAATTFMVPVVEIDGVPIGDGAPGPITRRLRQTYLDYAGGLMGPDIHWTYQGPESNVAV